MSYKPNIIIKNNVVGQSAYSDGISSSTYKYDGCGWCFGSASIIGNMFSGINSSSSNDMLRTTDGSCIIRDNKFVRSTSIISSYIKHNTSTVGTYIGMHEITDNIFDQTHIDGYTEQLVIGLNPGTIYTRNRNQTGYLYVSIWDNSIASFTSDGPFYENNPIDFKNFSSSSNNGFIMKREKFGDRASLITEFISTDDNNVFQFSIRRSFNLESLLEKGMIIGNIRIGGRAITGTKSSFDTGGSDYFGVRLKIYDGIPNMSTENYNTAAPAVIWDFLYKILTSTDYTALSTSTQYPVDIEGGPASTSDGNYNGFIQPDYMTIGNGYNIEMEFRSEIAFDSNDFDLLFTPIEVKYRW